ncbi:MAG: hypothetical protein QNJ37_10280 [Crocosphaera sp.]|nr:hypothetical protein [Crocosphaera sp.]
MSNLKITNLPEEQTSQLVDLKAKAEKGDEKAIKAFKSLGGVACCCWATQLF